MGLVARVTERVRIGTNVLVVRAGIGWMAEEFASLGVPRSERAAHTTRRSA